MGGVYLVDGGGSRGIAGLGKRGGERHLWVALWVGSIFGWDFATCNRMLGMEWGEDGGRFDAEP